MVFTVWAWLRSAVSRRRVSDDGEKGQGLVEYAFILLLIALLLILIVLVIGNQTKNLYSNVENQFPQ